MATLPINGTVSFRPNSAAVKAARTALDKAQAAFDEGANTEAGQEAGPALHLVEARDAAQKALTKAEEAAAKADPEFRLIVPTGETMALVAYDMEMDRNVPISVPLDEAIDAILTEATEKGLPDDAMAAINKAKELTAEGKNVAGADWEALAKAASRLFSWREFIAPFKLTQRLQARYIVKRHLVLRADRKVLSDADLESPDVKPYFQAIAAELDRLSTLTEDDAKNSVES